MKVDSNQPWQSKPLFVEDLDHILEHTRELWEQVRGQNLFITGGTGFFGMWLLESFCHVNTRLDLGASITVLTRNAIKFCQKAPHLTNHRAVSLWDGDVRSFEFPTGDFRFVIHAGTSASASVQPSEMFSTIVDGTRRAIDFAREHGSRRFLFVSSGAVYGPQPQHISSITEDYCGAPTITIAESAYGEGKRVGELLCALNDNADLVCTIARCFAFVGPHLPLDAHFAVGNFIRDKLTGGPIRIAGDGTALRSYMYASDLAIWLWKILFLGRNCRPYNVGSGDELTIVSLANKVSELSPGTCVEMPSKTPDSLACNRYVPDISRASVELELEVRVGLDVAIRKTSEWHSNSRKHCSNV